MNLIAPPFGGAIFNLVGPLPALALNAMTYLTSQVSIASVKDFGPERPSGLPAFIEVVADVAIGWQFVMRDAALYECVCRHGFRRHYSVFEA